MSKSMSDSMNCPVCLETMSVPIKQCEKGHSTCGPCVLANNLQTCPLCRSPMTTARNYQLEQLISELKAVTLVSPCNFASKGCKYILKMDEAEAHHLECKHRIYKCEGKKFCGWNCDWSGNYDEIVQHFKTDHQRLLEFKTDKNTNIKIDFAESFADTKVIDYQNGQQILWYKYKVDVKAEKVYWLFQYVGLKKQAAQYFYEFEIKEGATRKLKFTEICESDCKDAHVIFNQERCVAISFKMAKNFLDDKGELAFRFRIMKIKPAFPGTAPSNPASMTNAQQPGTIHSPGFVRTPSDRQVKLNLACPPTYYPRRFSLQHGLLGHPLVQRSISVPSSPKGVPCSASTTAKKYKKANKK